MSSDLPEPGAPLVLADGTTIDVKDGRVVSAPDGKAEYVDKHGEVKTGRPLIEVPRISEAQEIITRVRRRVSELPAPPRTMNACAVVLSYYLYGLDAYDIAIATNLTTHQVENIMLTEAFDDMKSAILKTMSQQGASDVRSYFQKASKQAAENLVDLSLNSVDDGVRLRATDSVLDRAGHRPVDTVEHKHRMEGGLTIRVIKSDDDDKLIDLTPVESN